MTFPLIPDKSNEKRDGRVWETGSATARLFMVNFYVDADAGLGKDEFENFLSFGNASSRREADYAIRWFGAKFIMQSVWHPSLRAF